MKCVKRNILVTLGILSCLGMTAATPGGAHYTPDTDELVWFAVMADSHVGANLGGYGDKDTDRLDWMGSVFFDTVLPDFIVMAGDLTDATNGLLIPTGQKESEWETYREILDANGMTPNLYYDIPGNHDHYGEWPLDHYLGWSIQGAEHDRINHSWVRYDEAGNKYLFIGVASCASNGAIAPLDNAGLDDDDLQFLQETLTAHSDASLITVFGHHPVEDFNDGEDIFRTLLAEHSVSAYIFGHTHDYETWWENATYHVNITSLTKRDDDNIALVAFDGLGMSLKVFDVMEWPQVMITTPADAELGESHLHDYMISNALTDASIRALAFHPDGIVSAEATIDGEWEITMTKIGDRLWEAQFNATTLDPNEPHTVQVRVASTDDEATDLVVFYLFEDTSPIENPEEIEPMPEMVEIVEEPTVVEFVEQVEYVEFVEWEDTPDIIIPPDDDYEIIEDSGTADTPNPDSGDSIIPEWDLQPDKRGDSPASTDLGTGDQTESKADSITAARGHISSNTGDSGCTVSGQDGSSPLLLWLCLVAPLLLVRSKRLRRLFC